MRAADTPMSGEVEIRSTEGEVFLASADADGRFALDVPPGTYMLVGTSPAFQASQPCRSPDPVVVNDRQSVVVEVQCHRR